MSTAHEQTLDEKIKEILYAESICAINHESAVKELEKLIISESVELLTEILKNDVSDFPTEYGCHDVIYISSIRDRITYFTNKLNQL